MTYLNKKPNKLIHTHYIYIVHIINYALHIIFNYFIITYM